jgi:hypothetical protein
MRKIASIVFAVLCLCLFAGAAKAQTAADWSEGDIWYKVIDTENKKVAVIRNPSGQDYAGTVTIPETVTHEDVPYTVTAIANRAFAYDENAESTVEYVNLPPSIVSFGSCAFQFCKGLKSIVIPDATLALWDNNFDGVDDDEGATFMGCTGLEEITIGSSITNMAAPNGLFNGELSALRKITVLATTPPTEWSDGGGFAFAGEYLANVPLFVPNESLDNYIYYWYTFATPDQDEYGSGAGIYPINFEAEGIFYKTTSASPPTVAVTFSGESSNTLIEYTGDVTVPKNVAYGGTTYAITSVDAEAFSGCQGLTSVTLPEGVTYIGHHAFAGGITTLTSVTLPEGLISMGNCAFQFCSGLQSIVIPNSVVALWDDDGDGDDDGIGATFMGCTGLEEITIGSGITNMIAQHGVFVPNSDLGFSNLQKVTCYATTPPQLNDNSFQGLNDIPLYVPAELVETYTNSWWEDSYSTWGFTGPYAIGTTCLPPTNLQADITGHLTWSGDAAAYNLIISPTVLDAEALAGYSETIIPVTGTEYNSSPTLGDENGAYYAYLQSDCGDGKTSTWVSASFYYYTGDLCDYTIQGQMYTTGNDPYENWGWDWSWYDAHLQIIQNDIVIVDVYNPVEAQSISLIPGIPATFKWIGSVAYPDDPSWFRVTDANGSTLIQTADLYGDADLGSVDIDCSSVIDADNFEEGGIWYQIIDTEAETKKVAVIGNPSGQDYSGTVTVPETVTHEDVQYTVTAIANRAFAASTVEHVNLPNTIVSFGGCAFQNASSLKEIVIPNSVTALWDDNFDGSDDSEGGTFMGCTGLEEITIGASITNMVAPNGIFSPVGQDLKSVTCYATTPPTLDGNSFRELYEGVLLFVPAELVETYRGVAYWDNFAGPYAIGTTCFPPTNLHADITGHLTWSGDAAAYNLIISPTVLDADALASYSGIISVGETEYDSSQTLGDEDGTYYAYLQSDCGDENTSTWVSASFYYYTGDLCDYTIQGDMYDVGDEGYAPYEEGYGSWYGSHVQIVQNDIVIADVYDPIDGQPISLISDVPATFKWIGSGDYSDEESGWPCWFRVVPNAGGATLVEAADLYGNTDFGPVDINCSSVIDADNFKVDGIWYRIIDTDNKKVAVIRNPDGQDYTGTVTIPGTVTHENTDYTVTAIADHAFAYAENAASTVEHVNLPNTIVSIGSCAFQYASSLKEIVIPNSVTALWDDNFDGINDGVGATFMGCVGLEEITIGSGIGDNDMITPNGLFNPVGPDLKSVTCYATTPPELDGNSFRELYEDVPLFVPAELVETYRGVAYWDDFAGPYAIGTTCFPPTNLQADITGRLTWSGDAGAYNLIISQTKLDANALAGYSGTIIRVTGTEYNSSLTLGDENGAYYAYLQRDCGSGNTSTWVSASFYYYTGDLCNYTIRGEMYEEGFNPYENWGEEWHWFGAHVQIVQNDIVIADVYDPVDAQSISLIPGIPATFKWIGSDGDYSYEGSSWPCWFRVTDARGAILIQAAGLYGDTDLGPVDIDCSPVIEAENFEAGGIWYEIIAEDKVAVIRNPSGQDYTGTVTVPSTVTHEGATYTVTAVGNRAFAESTVEHVNLPNTIVSIGGCAFQYASSLKDIVIPNSVTALWDDDFDGYDDSEGATFMGCTGLEEITIGSGITNMAAPNGLFNPVGPDLKSVTCYATTPPELDGNSFRELYEGVPLFVPAELVETYRGVAYWDNFAGPYAIGTTCFPPTNLQADIIGRLTWSGNAGAYNLIISQTELDADALAGYSGAIIRVTGTGYDPSQIPGNENGTYYAYLQSDCGDRNTSTWISASFYYYTGDLCEYTIQGDMYPDKDDPYKWRGWGWFGSHVQIVQNDIVIADVYDPVDAQSISLIPGIPATFKWIGSDGDYSYERSGYPCWFRVTNAEDATLVEAAGLYGNTDFGPIDINCGGVVDMKKLNMNDASITPTLSNGFVTVNAGAGSVVKVMDLTGCLLKQETITGAAQKVELNYANGVYLIMLENSHSRFVQKVILKR